MLHRYSLLHDSILSIFRIFFSVLVIVAISSDSARDVIGQDAIPRRGDHMIDAYFRRETDQLQQQSLSNIVSLDQWEAEKSQAREQLLEMLGLDPLPGKTPLYPEIVGTIELPGEGIVVERLHFQSRPGLYVTANLYRPKEVAKPLPTILYLCGHAEVVQNGISLGNKTHYQHHGLWFARNGYVCLILDTLQLGEIQGIHHGTYRENMWWWLNRGYTPAGVEAWNCVRALDYLESRPEVDASRFGVTGRSGGGAYSWWIGAIDDRIRCAVPVAGITDLQNHVVDGCVEGHCDCMFMVNTYRWDYPQIAALLAPRPLLISNTDTDPIFPLDGVYRTFEKVRGIYRLYGAADRVALNITAGGHEDTQELQVHAFRWFNHHLKGDDSLIEKNAVRMLDPEQLQVFAQLPQDQVNTRIHETFVFTEERDPDRSISSVELSRVMNVLQEKVFRGWPSDPGPLQVHEVDRYDTGSLTHRVLQFTSQPEIELDLHLIYRNDLVRATQVVFEVVSDVRLAEAWTSADSASILPNRDWLMAFMAPRGLGATRWNPDPRKEIQIRRRFYLLGQTVDGMRIFDVRRAIQALQSLDVTRQTPLRVIGRDSMAPLALYAALFEPGVTEVDVPGLPATHRDGPFLLNVGRFFDSDTLVSAAHARGISFLKSDR